MVLNRNVTPSCRLYKTEALITTVAFKLVFLNMSIILDIVLFGLFLKKAYATIFFRRHEPSGPCFETLRLQTVDTVQILALHSFS